MAQPIEILMPAELEGTKAVVRAWLKQVGDTVRRDEPLVELETDKVTTEVPAPADGVLLEILLASDAEAQPGALLGRLGKAVAAEPVRAAEAPQAASAPERTIQAISSEQIREHRLSPAVRRAISQHGLDPSMIEAASSTVISLP